MRTISTRQQYLATTDAGGAQVHQFAASEIVAPFGECEARLAVVTRYRWDGRVAITVAEPRQPWTLSVRAPAWGGQAPLCETRGWQAGESIDLAFDMLRRMTMADSRVDAICGTAAFERGPFVYAVESADLDAAAELAALRIRPDEQPTTQACDDIGDGVVGLVIGAEAPNGVDVAAPAITSFAWGNRRRRDARLDPQAMAATTVGRRGLDPRTTSDGLNTSIRAPRCRRDAGQAHRVAHSRSHHRPHRMRRVVRGGTVWAAIGRSS